MIVSKTLSVGGPLDHGVTMPTIDNIAHKALRVGESSCPMFADYDGQEEVEEEE